MKGCHLFQLFCLPAFCLFAKNYEQEIEQANLQWNSRQFDKAIESYHEILEKPLTSFQKQELKYNIATSLLAKKEFQKAISQFNAIGQVDSPYVAAKLHYNLAIAHAKLAKELSIEQALYHYHEALLALQKSQHAECQLQEFLGKKSCTAPPRSKRLQDEILRQLAHLHDEEENKVASQILKLENQLSLVDESISIIEKVPKEMYQDYLALFVAKLQDILKLWEESVIKDAAALSLFSSAKDSFRKMTEDFAKGDFQKSRQELKAAREYLDTFIDTFFAENVLKARLEALIKSTQMAIYFGFIPSLKESYAKLEKLAREHKISQPSLPDLLKNAQEALQKAESSDQEKQEAFLTLSLSLLQEALFELEPKTATSLLNYLIEQQAACLKLSEAFKDEDLVRPASLCLENLMIKADDFIPLVYQEQLKLYKEGSCQAAPWDEALPLFNEGRQFAVKADKNKKSPASQKLQQLALERWRAAALAIANPHKQGSCQATAQQTQDKQETSQQSSLELLQSMQQDDQVPLPKEPMQTTDKPW